MSDRVQVKRALLSVSDKTGLVAFATALANEFNVELISTGGTAKTLRDAGLAVRDVSDLTGFPEMMDGRVKTLHPKVHGGLLAIRDDAGHAASMREHGIEAIDLVVVNLYPFAATIAKPNSSFEDAIENIDIGGPSMIRSAAKNHHYVTVVTDASAYDAVLADLRAHAGATTLPLRRALAQKAFATTGAYDAMIANYLAMRALEDAKSPVAHASESLPAALCGTYKLAASLRYGENPHQSAALYTNPGHPGKEASVARAVQHHGKELSYINLLDADAALSVVKDFATPAACIVKHATPCGVGVGDDIATALERAYTADPLAAFGGIIAVNRPIDAATASLITAIDKLLEVIVAPGYEPAALETLKGRWKNVRLLEVSGSMTPDAGELSMHNIVGGILIQSRDLTGADASKWRVVSNRQPSAAELADLKFAWIACKHVKSNAIVLAKNGQTVGIGGGQVDRVTASGLAIGKSSGAASGSVAASDAFFPFPDGPELLFEAGVTAIVQPGGAMKDQLTIDAADAAGAAMVFTGERHFRH